ncbi:thymidylate kinase [Methanococcus maripaludis]|uniref:Thymidylate kinase n=1 Tax=Methanococcus maripaludis TaxID=39152 RepID=A0A7J9P0Y3_METMI|nr:AAA family ATPase [Methanococcus maripaludis]MBA2851686.1 thymidylate kinase [Methanococcus maripaludis]
MVKIIAFTGPASSGKTTIIDAMIADLEDKDKKVIRISNVTRDVFTLYSTRYGVTSLDDLRDKPAVVFQFQKDCIARQIAMEMSAKLEDVDFVISDRSVFDYMVYASIFMRFDDYVEYIKVYEQQLHVSRYDELVYTEPLTYVADNFRTTEGREAEICIYEKSIKPLATLVLPNTSVENRLNYVEGKLESVVS